MTKKNLLKKIKDFLKGDEVMGGVKTNLTNLETTINTLSSQQDETIKQVKGMFEFYKDDVVTAKKELDNIKKKNTSLDDELKACIKSKDELKEVEKEVEKRKLEIEELEKRLKESQEKLKKTLKESQEEAKKKDSIIDELKVKLKDIQDTFIQPKLLKLLETVLANPTLEKFRNKTGITDKTPSSSYQLLIKLCDAQSFVDSYYEDLKEYKKSNQDKMCDKEIEFYKMINEYFSKEIILNPDVTTIEDSFDKSKHKGVNNELNGEIDNGIVLIPADTINHDKIIVKLKN